MINPLEKLEEDDPSPFEADSDDDGSEELQEAFGEMSRETLLAFVSALLFAHVGVMATGVGLLLVAFNGQWLLGGAIAVGGIAALALTGWIYRWYENAK
ncbi:hypothetical protein C491_06498 [Natronococcus amylolyticus DSM 10524]|uniref:DUF7322 domain-containing protein n=1 Tax=Natronococcus amylolyticus DSM 10524 TaxID=1227497 RepID=L9XFI1_9EURY|nr:hypothetical protein [Natronococcus amylolyticus]ELY59438.1 hypothetical protein C491_06498 [Natronococcus amylolyticus DSM 10524]